MVGLLHHMKKTIAQKKVMERFIVRGHLYDLIGYPSRNVHIPVNSLTIESYPEYLRLVMSDLGIRPGDETCK